VEACLEELECAAETRDEDSKLKKIREFWDKVWARILWERLNGEMFDLYFPHFIKTVKNILFGELP